MAKRTMAKRRGRRFWERVVAEVERGGATPAKVAARHGVVASTLRWWLYQLRRERRSRSVSQKSVRLLPVEVVSGTTPSRTIDVRVATGDVITFDEGVNVTYVASLVAALRTTSC